MQLSMCFACKAFPLRTLIFYHALKTLSTLFLKFFEFFLSFFLNQILNLSQPFLSNYYSLSNKEVTLTRYLLTFLYHAVI